MLKKTLKGVFFGFLGIMEGNKHFKGGTMVGFKDGKIVTDLGRVEFISLLLKEWGEYSEREVEAILDELDPEELTDAWLAEQGYTVTQNTFFIEGDAINILMVGDGKWVIEDYDSDEMEQFVIEFLEEPM